MLRLVIKAACRDVPDEHPAMTSAVAARQPTAPVVRLFSLSPQPIERVSHGTRRGVYVPVKQQPRSEADKQHPTDVASERC